MADMKITQKEIEDKLFNFIEENFGKKRHECFNEVVNFVEYEIISILSSNEIQKLYKIMQTCIKFDNLL